MIDDRCFRLGVCCADRQGQYHTMIALFTFPIRASMLPGKQQRTLVPIGTGVAVISSQLVFLIGVIQFRDFVSKQPAAAWNLVFHTRTYFCSQSKNICVYLNRSSALPKAKRPYVPQLRNFYLSSLIHATASLLRWWRVYHRSWWLSMCHNSSNGADTTAGRCRRLRPPRLTQTSAGGTIAR